MKNILVLMLMTILVACGANPAPTGPLSKTIPLAGGNLESQGLRLEFPAGSVRKNLEVKLTPLPANSGLARFRLEPAGTLLAKPITLKLTSASLPAGAVLVWNTGSEALVFPSSRSGNTLSAQISRLGYGASGQVQRLSGEGTTLEVAILDCQFQASEIRRKLNRTDWSTDLDQATALYDQLLVLREACAELSLEQLQQRACEANQGAVANAQLIAANSYARLDELIKPLISSQAMVMSTGESCDISGTQALIEDKFAQFFIFLEADLQDPKLGDSQTLRDLTRLFSYDAYCQYLGLDKLCNRFSESLYPLALDQLRNAAFRECRQDRSALTLSQLYGVGRVVASEGPFMGYGRYTYTDLEADLHHCTNPSLRLRVFDKASTVPEELPKAAKTLQSGATAPGAYTTSLNLKVPLEGSLNLSGTVQALVCPTSALSTDQLVLRINKVEVARRSISGLSVNPIDLLLARDLLRAGLSPTTKQFTAELWREGSGCGGFFSNVFKLFSINVSTIEPFKIGSFVGPATIKYGSSEKYFWSFSGTPEFPVTVKRSVAICELSRCDFPLQTVVNAPVQSPFEIWFCRENSSSDPKPAVMAVDYVVVDNLGMTTNTVRASVRCVP